MNMAVHKYLLFFSTIFLHILLSEAVLVHGELVWTCIRMVLLMAISGTLIWAAMGMDMIVPLPIVNVMGNLEMWKNTATIIIP